MKKAFMLLVFIGALLGVLYFATLPQNASLISEEQQPTTTPATAEAHTIAEDTPSYAIDVEYRLSGHTAIDAKIEAEIQNVASAFKADAATFDPAVSSRPYSLSGEVAELYVASDIVSERINLYQDTGGAHGLPIVLTLNYDATTGEEISLDRALSLVGLGLGDVARRAQDQLHQEFGSESVFEDGAAPTPANYQTFVVSPHNVTFIFQAYQVVAFAAGMPEVTFARIDR